MKSLLLSLVLATGALALAGCGKSDTSASRESDSPAATPAAPKAGDLDGIVNAYMGDLESMGGLFKQVTDEASAKQHAPEIKALSQRLQGYADQLKGVDETKRGMAFAAQAQRFMQVQQELMPEIGRVAQNPALAKHIGDAMKLPRIK